MWKIEAGARAGARRDVREIRARNEQDPRFRDIVIMGLIPYGGPGSDEARQMRAIELFWQSLRTMLDQDDVPIRW